MLTQREEFDLMIGRLDRILSEVLDSAAHAKQIDHMDVQTLKHHAEDMVGAGNKVLALIQPLIGCMNNG